MATDEKKDMSKAPSWTWWVSGAIAVLMAIIITIAVWPSAPLVPDDKPNKKSTAAPADYPLCAEQKIYDLRGKTTQITVQLHQNCWSGWIMLPETNYSAVVDTLSPGDLEYKFWNGERILIPDKSVAADISQGRNYGSAYRLRGYGEAIITKKEVI
ncbi:MAG: hypothetical protein AAB396_02235 [Patescibacteria group bacterium]